MPEFIRKKDAQFRKLVDSCLERWTENLCSKAMKGGEVCSLQEKRAAIVKIALADSKICNTAVVRERLKTCIVARNMYQIRGVRQLSYSFMKVKVVGMTNSYKRITLLSVLSVCLWEARLKD